MVTRDLKEFIVAKGELDYRGGGGDVMTRPLSMTEVKEELKCSTNFHVETMMLAFRNACKDKGIMPEMANEATELQPVCP